MTGAKGIPPTENYKVCATYMDGFKATSVSIVLGGQASGKAKAVANAVIGRSSAIFKHMGMQDFDAKYVTTIGAEDSFGVSLQIVQVIHIYNREYFLNLFSGKCSAWSWSKRGCLMDVCTT